MIPRLIDGGFHTVGQDDELRRPAVVVGAKAYDVHLSHSGREISEKLRGDKRGLGFAARRLVIGYICRSQSPVKRHFANPIEHQDQ
jgi:hypothetical protein